MDKTIKAKTPVMFIRVPDYEDFDSIEEHIKILKKNKYVWMVKLGRYPNPKFLDILSKNNGLLLIKSTPKHGNKLYLCEIDLNNTNAIDIYPEYYDDIFKYYGYNTSTVLKEFFWIKIKSFIPIKKEILNSFEIISTKTNLMDAVFNSRAPQVYAEAKEDVYL